MDRDRSLPKLRTLSAYEWSQDLRAMQGLRRRTQEEAAISPVKSMMIHTMYIDILVEMHTAVRFREVSMELAVRWINTSHRAWKESRLDNYMRWLLMDCRHPSIQGDGRKNSFCTTICLVTNCRACADAVRKIAPDPPTIDDIMRAVASK